MAAADSVAAPRSGAGEASPDRAPFLAYINDDESESTLRMGLSDHLDSIAVRRGGVRAAIRALERERTPRVLVVDLSDEDDPVGPTLPYPLHYQPGTPDARKHPTR